MSSSAPTPRITQVPVVSPIYTTIRPVASTATGLIGRSCAGVWDEDVWIDDPIVRGPYITTRMDDALDAQRYQMARALYDLPPINWRTAGEPVETPRGNEDHHPPGTSERVIPVCDPVDEPEVADFQRASFPETALLEIVKNAESYYYGLISERELPRDERPGYQYRQFSDPYIAPGTERRIVVLHRDMFSPEAAEYALTHNERSFDRIQDAGALACCYEFSNESFAHNTSFNFNGVLIHATCGLAGMSFRDLVGQEYGRMGCHTTYGDWPEARGGNYRAAVQALFLRCAKLAEDWWIARRDAAGPAEITGKLRVHMV